MRLWPFGKRNGRPRSGDDLYWRALTLETQFYVAAVIAGGCAAVATFFPRSWPDPLLFVLLAAASCLTSSWKVNLPISLSSGSTLSVSYAADLMALILLGPGASILVAAAGAFTQCTVNVRHRYPLYRTAFSMASAAVAMAATGVVYLQLGGAVGQPDLLALPKPLLGAIATCFFVNTGLVATVIALSLGESIWKVWHDDFLWSGPAFVVAGAFGALTAVLIGHGLESTALLMLAPVYLTYRSYRLFLSRFDDQKRHYEETRRLHEEAVDALEKAQRAERALAAEKERLSVTLQSVADGIITTDLDGTLISINAMAETLTGWTQEDAQGQPLSVVFRSLDPETREPCDNNAPALVERAQTSGTVRSTTLIARDLAEHPIEERAVPLRDIDGRTIGIVLAFRDITDAIGIQQERAKAARLSSLGLLAGGMAHDFNDVLMSIMGNVSLARAAMPRGTPAVNALIEAEQACVRARQLTWQLLTFSKGGVPVKATVAIARVLRECATLVLRGSNVRCTFELDPDLWNVHADESQVVQVFSNVLLNAQQAMPHGGWIEVAARNVFEPDGRTERALRLSRGPHVRVSITDKGIGIAQEHLDRIFDPYFTTKQRGSGLGLATAYSIIKHHGGAVAVESCLGRGTAVHITLPAVAGVETCDPADLLMVSQGGPHRILVMDDESSIRRLAINMLEALGYDGEVVQTGSAAVDRFRRALDDGHPFDIVMLDLIVPGEMGGKEAMGRLAAIDPTVKGIVISGYAQDTVLTDYQRHGFKAALSKPFSLQELRTCLQSLLASSTSGWQVH
jgi:PAS domain S-box-containing protein